MRIGLAVIMLAAALAARGDALDVRASQVDDLTGASRVVTNVTFDAEGAFAAISNRADALVKALAPAPGNYATVSNRAMSALQEHQPLSPATNYTDSVAAEFESGARTVANANGALQAFNADTAGSAMSATWAARLSDGGSVGADNFTYADILGGFLAASNYTDAVAEQFADGARSVQYANNSGHADYAVQLYGEGADTIYNATDLIRASTNAARAVVGAATNGLPEAIGRKQDALPYQTNAIPYAAISGAPQADLTQATNYTDAALGAFAGTGTVERARSYGTPTRWTDATGCVWEVVLNVWVDRTDGNVFKDGMSIFPATDTDDEDAMRGYLYYDPTAMEYVGGTGGGWYYNGVSSAESPNSVFAGGPDATSLDNGRFTFGNLTNLVGRVALTSDIPDVSGYATPADVTAAIREQSLGGIWDSRMGVWWTPIMEDGALRYIATTNVNLSAEGNQ